MKRKTSCFVVSGWTFFEEDIDFFLIGGVPGLCPHSLHATEDHGVCVQLLVLLLLLTLYILKLQHQTLPSCSIFCNFCFSFLANTIIFCFEPTKFSRCSLILLLLFQTLIQGCVCSFPRLCWVGFCSGYLNDFNCGKAEISVIKLEPSVCPLGAIQNKQNLHILWYLFRIKTDSSMGIEFGQKRNFLVNSRLSQFSFNGRDHLWSVAQWNDPIFQLWPNAKISK